MAQRKYGTNIKGAGFSQDIIDAVWEKSYDFSPKGQSASDAYGNRIKYAKHGRTDSPFGWEIDHIKPVAKGGTDDLHNSQPFQWQANRFKSDTYH